MISLAKYLNLHYYVLKYQNSNMYIEYISLTATTEYDKFIFRYMNRC